MVFPRISDNLMVSVEGGLAYMWSSVKRISVTELYTWPIIAVVMALLAGVGLSAIGQSALARAALGIAIAMGVYRLRYRRW